MIRWKSKRLLAGLCLALLALFVIRPGAGRLRGRVSQSLSQALGRNVEISTIRLRLLPRPAFQLDNLVVHDGPSFGAEPLLRAPDVTAYVSLAALLRGRLQVSSLSLSEASLNLTRDAQGRWNLHDAIERTSRSTLSPTGRLHAGGAPFPYIEGTSARINLKIGTEKTHFALTDAEFALWQDSENTWGLRVKAAPLRTDTNLTDVGTLEMSGLWRRAAALEQTPVQFSFQWKHAQMGQLSKLVYGADQGWRGEAVLAGAISGTPEKLKLVAETSVDDFRRQDVLGSGDLRLKAKCAAEYSVTALVLSNLDCLAPSATGLLELKGEAAEHENAGSTYDFRLSATKVPAAGAVSLLERLNPRFQLQPVTGGDMDGSFQLNRNDTGAISWRGEGSIQDLELAANGSDTPLTVANIPFSASSEAPDDQHDKRKKADAKRPRLPASTADEQARALRGSAIKFGPFNLAPGKSESLQAQVTVSLNDYLATVHGPAGVKRLLQWAHLFGVPAPNVSAEGNSNVDLTISGSWSSADRPLVTGHAQLHNVHAQVRGLNSAIEIANANVLIHKERVDVQNLSATAATAAWRGSLSFGRPCPSPSDCEIDFNLKTAELNSTALNKLLNPSQAKDSWYRIFSVSESPQAYLMQARASGKVAIDKLLLGSTECRNFSSEVRLESGTVSLANYSAEVLDGRIRGNLKAVFAARKPSYSGTGNFDGIALSSVAALMHDDWAQGTADAQYEFTAQGSSLAELFDSADLKSDFDLTDSEFPHVALSPTSGSLRASRFAGTLLLHASQFTFDDAKLEGPSGVYKVSGTAELDGSLSLKMTSETNAYNVTGTLLKTRVAALPTAQAALKP